jgi:hypothetical protein
VYIKDVESALDGLAALPSADPTYPASERADADTAGAKLRLAIAKDQALILEKWAKEWEKDQFQRAHDARIIADNLVKLASERADAGKDAALTDEQKKAIAQDVHVTCSCIPGATFYNAAEMAIDAILAANKGSQNGR